MHTPKIITPGTSLTIQKQVTDNDTAVNYGSGKLENLLATPALVNWMIEAASQLVDSDLEEGYASIGRSLYVSHDKPTILNDTVTLKVWANAVEGNRILVKMEAYDEVGQIAEGELTRYVVHQQSLINRANQREAALQNRDF